MKTLLCSLGVISLITLSGCGGSGGNNDPGNNTELIVDELPAGIFAVSVGDENNPTNGSYYADANGNRLLIINDENEQATQLFQQQEDGPWSATPETSEEVVTVLISSIQASPDVDISSLSGSYVTSIPSGEAVTFSISSNSEITPGVGPCQLSGEITEGTLPGTADISLNTTSCNLPVNSSGVLILDTNYSPAVFRIIADDGNEIVELLGFNE